MFLSQREAEHLVSTAFKWALIFLFGFIFAVVFTLVVLDTNFHLVDQSLDASMQRMIDTCTTEATETAEISEATRSLFPLARGPTSPPGALATHPRIPVL